MVELTWFTPSAPKNRNVTPWRAITVIFPDVRDGWVGSPSEHHEYKVTKSTKETKSLKDSVTNLSQCFAQDGQHEEQTKVH